MLLRGDLSFRGLGRVDQVKNEDSHNKAQKAYKIMSPRPIGVRAPGRRRAGEFAVTLAVSDASRPAKNAGQAVGH